MPRDSAEKESPAPSKAKLKGQPRKPKRDNKPAAEPVDAAVATVSDAATEVVSEPRDAKPNRRNNKKRKPLSGRIADADSTVHVAIFCAQAEARLAAKAETRAEEVVAGTSTPAADCVLLLANRLRALNKRLVSFMC